MESLHRACGVEVVKRLGASVGLSKGSERIVMHRPRLTPIISLGVRNMAAFLRVVGAEP